MRIIATIIIFLIPLVQYAHGSGTEKHARESEAIKMATNWLVLYEKEDAKSSYSLLADLYKKGYTEASWKQSVNKSNKQLGALRSRVLRRVVFYDNPANAPLPGIYAAVEFDSVYDNARKHFQYIMLHSLNEKPFLVMRQESKVLLIPPE